jgi:hypothetical protein
LFIDLLLGSSAIARHQFSGSDIRFVSLPGLTRQSSPVVAPSELDARIKHGHDIVFAPPAQRAAAMVAM